MENIWTSLLPSTQIWVSENPARPKNNQFYRKSSWATAEGVCQEMDRHAHLVAIHSDR